LLRVFSVTCSLNALLIGKSKLDQQHFLKFACLFEAGLAGVAMGIGWLVDVDPLQDLQFTELGIFNGLLLTLPLLLLFFLLQQLPYPALQSIRRLLQTTLAQPLINANWADLFILASIAGFSEELLFRGLIQTGLESIWGFELGLILSSIVFALLHAVTPLYGVLAFLMSCYLGLAFDYAGERNLLLPVVTHALYDFVVFWVIIAQARSDIKGSK
jgi:uncharacterized protein